MPRRRFDRALLGATALALVSVALGACSSPDGLSDQSSGCNSTPQQGEQLAGSTSTGAGGSGGSGGGPLFSQGGADAGPPAPDAGGLCGNEVHKIINNAPNLYFVFDTSGSMSEQGGGGYTKYELVDNSARLMLQNLGTLINVGAAVFPKGATDVEPCHVGGEVFPVSPGDPITPVAGPTTQGFMAATNIQPAGGTPTAASLVALLPGLQALKGKTVVLLATDGGPNCNSNASCTSNACISNIEGACAPPGTNCCAPGGPDGPEGCLDEAPTVAAVSAIAKAGIPVYVIGVPGSLYYSAVLNEMAVAGGAPQPGTTSYYDVEDLGTLEQVFQSIASVVISCDFFLDAPPKDEDHTNVWLDGVELPADPMNGWIWKSQDVIELVGTSCQKLKAGAVRQVQIVSGCPTEMPK